MVRPRARSSQPGRGASGIRLLTNHHLRATWELNFVPKNQGFLVRNSRGVLIGLADIDWISSQLQNLLGQLHIDPATLRVFLSDNTVLYIGRLAPGRRGLLVVVPAREPLGLLSWPLHVHGRRQPVPWLHDAGHRLPVAALSS